MNQSNKWYQKTIWIVALLILFFPVGLYLMWRFTSWPRAVKWGLTGLFVVLVIVGNSGSSSTQTASQTKPTAVEATKAQPTKEPLKDLDIAVENNEVAFRFTNNEKVDWKDCKFEINPKLFGGGYTYRQKLFVTRDVITIPYREFTNGDGTRFNSYSTKVQELHVSCKVNDVLRFGNFGLK